MPKNLKEGTARITVFAPILAWVPIGVDETFSVYAHVKANASLTEWKIKKVKGKENTYHLSVGGYDYTTTQFNKIISANWPYGLAQDWSITYHQNGDGYTITVADSPMTLWSLLLEHNPRSSQALGVMFYSIPPPPSVGTLFRFEFLD